MIKLINTKELQVLASEVSEAWFPLLQAMKQNCFEKQETCFTASVGFVGIQILLWQEWIRSFSVSENMRSVAVERAHEDTMPWLCYAVPYNKSVLLVIMSTTGVLENRRVFKELLRPSFRQMMRSLNHDGKVVGYAKANEILLNLGHDITKTGNITTPILHLETLEKQWNGWVSSTIEPQKRIQSYAISKDHAFTENEAVESFRVFSQFLWLQLVQRNIIATRRTKKWYIPRLLNATSKEYFTGCLIIYGDHKKFWENQVANSAIGGEGQAWV